MSNVELNCEKSFSPVDGQIVNRFIEFQHAIIDKNEEKLNEILTEDYVLLHMSGKKQSKKDFIAEVMDGTLNYFKSEIDEPTILHDDADNASLIADVTLTAEVYGSDGKWTLSSVVSFRKDGDEWYLASWDN